MCFLHAFQLYKNAGLRVKYNDELYVTGFEKMCIVHTSDFAHLEIHDDYMERCTDLKLSELMKE